MQEIVKRTPLLVLPAWRWMPEILQVFASVCWGQLFASGPASASLCRCLCVCQVCVCASVYVCARRVRLCESIVWGLLGADA